MAERDQSGISARLRRLPVQLLLALINGTAILVIVASVLAIVAFVRIENFAANISATMTQAVLSKIDLPSKDVLANIRELTGEARALGNTLREIKEDKNPILESEIARLRERLDALSLSVDRIGNARAILTDEVAARFGDAMTRTTMKLRDCSFNGTPPSKLMQSSAS